MHRQLKPLIPVTGVTKHSHKTWIEHRVALSLACGHDDVRWFKTTSTALPALPKRIRCYQCAQDAQEARQVYVAICYTCYPRDVGSWNPSMTKYIQLSARKLPKSFARADEQAHKREHPEHSTTVMQIEG